MATSFSSLFKSQAKVYSEFRPVYPKELYDKVFQFVKASKPPLPGDKVGNLAVDIATGTGQAAKAIAPHFERVIAFDAEEEQLKCAPSIDNVEFKLGTAESIDVPDASADVITCAQALHWFDLSQFYPEALRALTPGGVLAVWGYENCDLADPRANAEFYHLYDDVLGPHWSPRRKLVEAQYKGLEPEVTDTGFVEVERLLVDLKVEMPVKAFCGYLSSWSAYNTFKKKYPHAEDPIDTFCERLLAILSGYQGPFPDQEGAPPHEDGKEEELPQASRDTVISVTFPIFGFLARKAKE